MRCAFAGTATSSPRVGLARVAAEALQGARVGCGDRELDLAARCR